MNDQKNPYRKENKVLGKGAFGVVYLGTNVETNKKIALKEIPNNLDKEAEKSLSNEVSISSQLDNTNIVRMLEIVEINNKKYLAYELCNGGDLRRYMHYFKKFDEELIQIIAIKMINGLKELHKKNVIHHDIKPENILIQLFPDKDITPDLEKEIEEIKEITNKKPHMNHINQNQNNYDNNNRKQIIPYNNNNYMNNNQINYYNNNIMNQNMMNMNNNNFNMNMNYFNNNQQIPSNFMMNNNMNNNNFNGMQNNNIMYMNQNNNYYNNNNMYFNNNQLVQNNMAFNNNMNYNMGNNNMNFNNNNFINNNNMNNNNINNMNNMNNNAINNMNYNNYINNNNINNMNNAYIYNNNINNMNNNYINNNNMNINNINNNNQNNNVTNNNNNDNTITPNGESEKEKIRILQILKKAQYKLSDFGLSKLKNDVVERNLCGSPLYMSPELFHPETSIHSIENFQVDIWALGVLIFEMFFGRRPFEAFSIDELSKMYKKGEYYLNLEENESISKELLSFINMCLQEDPKIRAKVEMCDKSDFINIVIDQLQKSQLNKEELMKELGSSCKIDSKNNIVLNIRTIYFKDEKDNNVHDK